MSLAEKNHAAEYILSESNGNRSREEVTILSGEVLKAGHVLGRVEVAGATPAANAGNTGDGVMGTVTVGAAKAGVYRITFIEPATDLGRFIVEDPDGINVGAGVVGSAFTGGGLTFTIADGAADFVSGDGFTITIAAGSGKYKEYDPTNTDGSQVAVAVLYEAVDATGADKKGVITARDSEVVSGMLTWFAGANAGQIATGESELALKGIMARS